MYEDWPKPIPAILPGGYPNITFLKGFEAKQGATGNIREDVGADLPVSLNRIEVAETLPF